MEKQVFDKFIDISDVHMPDGIPKIDFYKETNSIELAISLFETCNLNCKFCFENHTKPIDLDRIDKLIDISVNACCEMMESQPKVDTVTLKIWGGELFFDEVDDIVFQHYCKFCYDFSSMMKGIYDDIKIRIAFLSNGVFTNRKRVMKLLELTDSHISFSYDPVDRFKSDAQKRLWLKNVRYFNKHNRLDYISITLTSHTIPAYIAGDTIFNKIKDENYTIDISYYVPNKYGREFLPSDDQMYKFIKWGLDNRRFDIFNIGQLVRTSISNKSVVRSCNCKSAIQIFADGIPTRDCVKKSSSLPREEFYGEHTDEINEDNVTECKCTLALLKRGCITCQYYDKCPSVCFVSILHKDYKIGVCPLKRAYQYILKHREIVEDYLKRMGDRKC